MLTIDDLNLKLLSELKEMAETMGVKNAKKLTKEELVYKILDQQAVSGEAAPAPKTETNAQPQAERKMRPRRRENVAPVAAAVSSAAKELSSEEMLQSIEEETTPSVPSFEEANEPSTPVVNEQVPQPEQQ